MGEVLMSKFGAILSRILFVRIALMILISLNFASVQAAQSTYSENEILIAVENLFGATTKLLTFFWGQPPNS